MKILHLGKFYPPFEGGIEAINKIVVDAFVGHQQRILSFNKTRYSIEEDIDSVPVIRAASSGVLASQPLSWKYFRELKRSLKLFQPDVIHLHYPNPLAALYLLILIKKRHKLIVHWHSDIVAQPILGKLFRPFENVILSRADAIIATSPNYIDSSNALKRHRDKITIIPCSINENKFKLEPSEVRSVEIIKKRYSDKPIILFVGRHVEYKGIEYLLQSEKFIKEDCVILIAGKGPLDSDLKEKYQSDRVHWLGKISDRELKYYLHSTSIFAFPSITKNEAFGVALAEAMYCHCPTVTFTINGSGVNWVSPNGVSGIECPNKDVNAYASAIDELLKNHSKRELLGNNAYRRVCENFTKSCVIPQYIHLYKKIINM